MINQFAYSVHKNSSICPDFVQDNSVPLSRQIAKSAQTEYSRNTLGITNRAVA
jgi:hypothetical protein